LLVVATVFHQTALAESFIAKDAAAAPLRKMAAATPTPTQPPTQETGEKGMLAFIKKLQGDKKLSEEATQGKFTALKDYEKSEAKMNYFFRDDSGYTPKDFVLRADVEWESASSTANWNATGFGFVFHESEGQYFYFMKVRLDGYVDIFRVDFTKEDYVNQRWIFLTQKYYGKMETPKGQAHIDLIVNKDRIYVYLNNKLAASAYDNALKSNERYGSGNLAYTLSSGTNAGFGTRVKMTNVELWEIESSEPEPTPEITPTRMADNTVLYEEDFEDGKADGWYVSGGTWKVIKLDSGKKVYEGTGPKSYPQIWLKKQGQEWRDYAFESKINNLGTGVFICVRAKNGGDTDFYNVFLPSGGDLGVLNKFIKSEFLEVKKITFKAEKDTWYVLRIEVIGKDIRIYVDDKMVGSYTFAEKDYLPKGTVGFYIGGGDKLQLDEVKVWSISKFSDE